MNLERKAGAKTFEIFLLLTKGTVEIWPIHKTCHLLCWHIFGYYLPNPAVTTNFPHTPSYRGCNYLHMCLFLQIEYKVSRAGFSLSISSLILESHKLLKMPQVGEICTWSLNRSFFFFFLKPMLIRLHLKAINPLKNWAYLSTKWVLLFILPPNSPL
jgi:hypothetical protein